MRIEQDRNLGPDSKIDIVVVNYRTPDDLTGFLTSMYSVLDEEEEMIASVRIMNVDPTREDEIVASYFESMMSAIWPTIVYNIPWNCGYAHACNKGGAQGGAATIAFFNADTCLQPGVIAGCMRHLRENRSWGVVGPKQFNSQNKLTHAGIFGSDDRPRIRGWQKSADEFSDIRDDCYSVSGSAYFIKRFVWNDMIRCPVYAKTHVDFFNGARPVGAFLETPHYYEETYLSLHVRKHGWKIGYAGDVGMYHEWHKASEVGSYVDRGVRKTSQQMFRLACARHGMVHD